MSSLAELPELVGFFSYSREDDEDFRGSLSALRDAIQKELRGQLGRNKTNFRLFQDQEAILPGKQWELEIKNAVGKSVFFIPLITPRSVGSKYCQFEFEAFRDREQAIGRNDLIFPVLYIPVAALQNETKWRSDPVLSIVGKRQYVDWRSLRYKDVNEPSVREQIGDFCRKVVEALSEPWISPEERKAQEQARKRQEAVAKRREEEERKALEKAAAAQRAEAERKRQEAEAKRREEEERKAQEQAAAAQRAQAAREARKLEKRKRGETEARALVNAVVGSFARAPAQDEASAWAKLPQPPDIVVLRRFLREFPSGAHAAEAKSKLAELERQAEAHKPEERKRGETEARALVTAVLRHLRRPTS